MELIKKYKYKIGDPVIFQSDSNFENLFDFDIDSLWIVMNYIESMDDLSIYDKATYLAKGFFYEMIEVSQGCVWASVLGDYEEARDDQLRLYTEGDSFVMEFYEDAKRELDEMQWKSKDESIGYMKDKRGKLSIYKKEYKYNVGDFVSLKDCPKSSNASPSSEVYIVAGYTEDDSLLTDCAKIRMVRNQKLIYRIARILPDAKPGCLGVFDYVAEDQLEPYKGKEGDLLNVFLDKEGQ